MHAPQVDERRDAICRLVLVLRPGFFFFLKRNGGQRMYDTYGRWRSAKDLPESMMAEMRLLANTLGWTSRTM